MLNVLALIQTIENEEDRSFVEELYLKYKDVMYQRAYQILQNKYDAEDAVSDTVKNIIKNLEKFDRSEDGVRRQLYIYTKNAALNIYNSNKRKNAVHGADPYDDELDAASGANTGNVEETAINRMNMEIALKAAEKLPDTQREPFYLFYFENYTYKEIADLLHTTTNSVGTRIVRAKEAIKEAILNGHQ